MSGGGGSPTTVQNNQPWAGAQPYLTDLLKTARDNTQSAPAYYPGQTYLDPTQGQMGAWDTKLNYADNVFGGTNAPNFGEATSALSKQLSGTPDYSGLQGSIDAANAPILRQLNQDIIPGLNSRATFLNNPTGGIKTLNRVLPDVADRMSENAAQLTEGERYRALNAQQQGLGNFGNIYAIGQDPGNLQSQFADYGAGFQNKALQDQIGRFNYYQNLPQQQLDSYGNLVTRAAGLGGQSTSTTNNPQQGVQNLAALASIIAAFA